MCLKLRVEKDIPYNKLQTRWKFVRISSNNTWRGPYLYTEYSKNKWNVSQSLYPHTPLDTIDGFHVFVTRADARKFLHDCLSRKSGEFHLKKVKVSGFKKSGTFCDCRSETWYKMRFIK